MTFEEFIEYVRYRELRDKGVPCHEMRISDLLALNDPPSNTPQEDQGAIENMPPTGSHGNTLNERMVLYWILAIHQLRAFHPI